MDDVRFQFQLTRPDGSAGRSTLRLRARDVTSGKEVFVAELTPEHLADLVSGAYTGGVEGVPVEFLGQDQRPHVGRYRGRARIALRVDVRVTGHDPVEQEGYALGWGLTAMKMLAAHSVHASVRRGVAAIDFTVWLPTQEEADRWAEVTGAKLSSLSGLPSWAGSLADGTGK